VERGFTQKIIKKLIIFGQYYSLVNWNTIQDFDFSNFFLCVIVSS